jgi:hypothetical protein
MRLVMLDAMNLNLPSITSKSRRYRVFDCGKGALRTKPAHSIGRHSQPVPCLTEKARPGITRHGNDPNLGRLCSRGVNHVTERVGGETGAMLNTVETFLLCRGQQLAINDGRRAGIAVIRVYSNNRAQTGNSVDINFRRVTIRHITTSD